MENECSETISDPSGAANDPLEMENDRSETVPNPSEMAPDPSIETTERGFMRKKW
jgi:hypothetical protein